MNAGPPAAAPLARVAIDPQAVERDLTRLVLTLIEFVRRLLEAQALRRVDAGTVSAAEAEALGQTLQAAENTIGDLCVRFGLAPGELNLDLGPLGKLL